MRTANFVDVIGISVVGAVLRCEHVGNRVFAVRAEKPTG